MSQKYKLYNLLFKESFSDTMRITPGTPEWDDLQKALAMANASVAGSTSEPAKDEPAAKNNYPAAMDKKLVMHFTPEEAEILRKAAGIMKSKG
jgi:hypothetical protein